MFFLFLSICLFCSVLFCCALAKSSSLVAAVIWGSGPIADVVVFHGNEPLLLAFGLLEGAATERSGGSCDGLLRRKEHS